ncbi:MAG TPA: DUF309 domain-containing protein [Bradyrhizobium sp.]|nr:DUF309 domain-containing protein [Bradyrhizobium sp.]
MSIASSTAANLPLPGWAYVPGETAEAEADHDTLWQAKALVPSRFRGYVPARHPALRYGIALNDAGYFWESQEVLEAVWAAAPQGGRERMLLRACIQIGNANLKLRMQKSRAASRLLGEALTEINALLARKVTAAGDGFADRFPAAALAALLKAKLAQPALSKADWIEIGKIGRI